MDEQMIEMVKLEELCQHAAEWVAVIRENSDEDTLNETMHVCGILAAIINNTTSSDQVRMAVSAVMTASFTHTQMDVAKRVMQSDNTANEIIDKMMKS